jgi:lysine-N-methylase
MKLYAPKYYKNFKCIADKCEHSCCIGWEIDIDGKTLDKYKALKNGYGDVINKSISAKDTPHFILKDRDKCPHLHEQGLCKIILNLGDFSGSREGQSQTKSNNESKEFTHGKYLLHLMRRSAAVKGL